MGKRKPRYAAEEEKRASPGWLTTFNDMMTLLMVFFVLIFAMGTLDVDMLKSFQIALRSGLGVLFEGKDVGIKLVDPHSFVDLKDESFMSLMEGHSAIVKDHIKDLAADLGFDVSYTKKGVVISLRDAVFFRPATDQINPEALSVLDRIIELIRKTSNPVRIEGHTDNKPIHADRFPSNWELSTARAVNVLKYLVENGKVAPKRLSAAGYGESRPVFPNDTPENRAKNRRVEFVLVTEEK